MDTFMTLAQANPVGTMIALTAFLGCALRAL